MRIVAALGGNALLRRGEALSADAQRVHAHAAALALAKLARGHELVVTHGNGPQVGLLAEQAEALGGAVWPLDVLDAETEGMIGSVLERELRNELGDREVATLLTHVLVDPNDPGFSHPSKPIGPFYDVAQSEALMARGWTVCEQRGALRRVVASPEPRGVLGCSVIDRLAADGVVVICGGGGGIPVVRRDQRLEGVEAVVDKDLTAALLARVLGADALLLLTDVPGLLVDPDADNPEVVSKADAALLDTMALPEGSMGPKAQAALRFAATGGMAAIGALENAAAVLRGAAGTRIVHDLAIPTIP